jgi:uroporphyrinogen-III synthase
MLPLADRRILVTRPRNQTSKLAALLEAEGATPILIPTIEIAPPASFCALDAALTTLRSFDWLLFTSANAVEAFTARAKFLRLMPDPRRIAAIGPATARAVTASGLAVQVDLVPDEYVAESFAEALTPFANGASMLLVRAAEARDVLPDALREAGATLTIAEAYRSVIPTGSIGAMQTLFATDPPDGITFTSGLTVHNLVALLDMAGLSIPPETVLASIGPITSQALADVGYEATVEADEATIPGLVLALVDYFG